MKKLRWVMDGGFWDLDLSTPVTVDGIARPVPNHPLPLGLSRGTKLSRPKQVDFLQRFMFLPFVPSYNGSGNTTTGGNGLSLEHVFALPFNDNWFATVLGQFNLQKLVSFVTETGLRHSAESSWLKNLGNHLSDKSFYALGLCSEFFITPDDTFLVSSEVYGDKKTRRSKAVYHHKASGHFLVDVISWL
ncbi:hypothetical protein IFM89_025511 [Coptis chinensis]|uniref:Uncharacterized protein n=1 Tax=Coptis chinensis TaxID=261450 RepID=A0A835H8R0_9MAGN|nr:hypothetical protein IFM89_025511 [Coptis chinensis]